VIRQAEVVRVLVREHGHAAVLRLHRVVGDPDAGIADLRAAVLVLRRADLAGLVEIRLAAMRPDRVLALGRVAVGLVATGVDDLEVIDVAVGLVEVAVVVEVVAVPLIEGLHVLGDLRVGAALGVLVVNPRREAVADQVLAVRADDQRAREAVAAAVAGLVVGHLHPV
jgi:hypothetical protein